MCAFEENYGDSNKSGKSLDVLDPTTFDIRVDDLEFFEKEVALLFRTKSSIHMDTGMIFLICKQIQKKKTAL